MPRTSEIFQMRVRGPMACFTRPEFKVERVSYEVMTPSAARGILEAVYWKPAIRWVVSAIRVLQPIRFIGLRRNEVNSRASVRNVLKAIKGEALADYFADEDRAQRNTVALRDVDYIVEAHFVATPSWHENDNFAKHAESFMRRLEKGQTFNQPYLGCREFAAHVEPATPPWSDALPTEERNKELGLMLHDLEFRPRIRPHFFTARLEDGLLKVPHFDPGVVPDHVVHTEEHP